VYINPLCHQPNSIPLKGYLTSLHLSFSYLCVEGKHSLKQLAHCKKRLSFFPSPARMSLTKLSLAGKNLRKIVTPFLQCRGRAWSSSFPIVPCYPAYIVFLYLLAIPCLGPHAEDWKCEEEYTGLQGWPLEDGLSHCGKTNIVK
jgi:hypothetical protein